VIKDLKLKATYSIAKINDEEIAVDSG